MEKSKVNKMATNSENETVNDTEKKKNNNFNSNSYEEWDDEEAVEEYFSKRKSRVRRQNKGFDRSYNKYDEEL